MWVFGVYYIINQRVCGRGIEKSLKKVNFLFVVRFLLFVGQEAYDKKESAILEGVGGGDRLFVVRFLFLGDSPAKNSCPTKCLSMSILFPQ